MKWLRLKARSGGYAARHSGPPKNTALTGSDQTPSNGLRDRVAAAVRDAADSTILAEWVCCEPVRADHDLCRQGDAARTTIRALFTDDPATWPGRSPVLDEVMNVVHHHRAEAEAKKAPAPGPVTIAEGLVVRPGDTLVLRLPSTTPAEQARRVADQIQGHFTGVEVLLIGGVEQIIAHTTRPTDTVETTNAAADHLLTADRLNPRRRP